jgi:hypothetical protein
VAPAPDVVVEEVTHAADRDAFLRFPNEHYRGDPCFVPPIVAERRDFLDPRRNPFFAQARAALFVARRGREVVGRIAAIVDSRYNRFHDTADGFFGFFECQNDPSYAASLFAAAADWVRRQGMTRLVGPVNLAFHYEVGLLIDGIERIPSMMMPYNPRFYGRLLEATGFTKLKDLFSYELDTAAPFPEKVVRLADRARASGSVTVRRLDTRNPERDINRIKAIYESMLRPGFGFAPMSDAEFNDVVQRVKPVILVRPELSLIAEVDGVPVAFSITLPDTNLAVKAAQGYLFPFGLAKLLWAARDIERLRVLLFGIADGYRRRGIDALLAHETYLEARKLGYTSGEIGWVLEDDRLINRTIQVTGARRCRVYRVYQRSLTGDAGP